MLNLKEFKKNLTDSPVAVLGLGISGQSVIEAFDAHKISYVAWDDDSEKRAQAKPGKYGRIEDLREFDMADFALLVAGPGIPLYHPAPHPLVDKAQKAGLEIIGDLEIFYRANPGRKIIAITGTNGKSTTTALVGHILNHAGINCSVGGNIGYPALSLETPPEDGCFVLEVSSFQLDLCKAFQADIAAILNITADHIDRHGSMERYCEAKKKVFANNRECFCVIDGGGQNTIKIAEELKKEGFNRICRVSIENAENQGDVFVSAGVLYDKLEGEQKEIGKINGIKILPGHHNHQNIAFAYSIVRDFRISPEIFIEAVKTFPGLPHRMYPVRVIQGVTYVNDSKATNPVSAATALKCYRKIYWIVGGLPKQGGLEGVEEELDSVKKAFVIGKFAEELADWLQKRGVDCKISKTLDLAVNEAHELAQSERGEPGGAGTVLLSPGCASYDSYESYEKRGQHFEKLVAALEERTMQ